MKREDRHQGRRLAYQSQSQIGYTIQLDFEKIKRCLSRHKHGHQKQITYDFSSSRADIGTPNANAQQIASALWLTTNSETATGFLKIQMYREIGPL